MRRRKSRTDWSRCKTKWRRRTATRSSDSMEEGSGRRESMRREREGEASPSGLERRASVQGPEREGRWAATLMREAGGGGGEGGVSVQGGEREGRWAATLMREAWRAMRDWMTCWKGWGYLRWSKE